MDHGMRHGAASFCGLARRKFAGAETAFGQEVGNSDACVVAYDLLGELCARHMQWKAVLVDC